MYLHTYPDDIHHVRFRIILHVL